jgi:hypothetical protein
MIELGGAIPNTIMDGRKVAWHYLTHWFIVDFVSSYPFDITFAYIQPDRPWSLQVRWFGLLMMRYNFDSHIRARFCFLFRRRRFTSPCDG